jgi:diphthine synthase
MSPHTAFQQILLTERQRHPAPQPSSSSTSEPSTAQSPARTKTAEDDDEMVVDNGPSLLPPASTLAISLSRMGTPTQRLVSGTLEELSRLSEEDFGGPLHSVVIVGKRLHPLELEFAGQWAIGGENGGWWKVGQEVYKVEREGH